MATDIAHAKTGDLSDLKRAHRALWARGDYSRPAQFVLPLGPRLVERAGVGPGMTVLDVATGTGNAAIPAAATGARVTGLDLTPELLAVARERALRAGVEVELVEGDAEALPWPDGSFDAVLSTLGVQFTPSHEAAARELARVCRAGGVIGLCNWTPDSFIGRLLATVARHLPPPPGVSSPILWGREEHVERLFAHTGIAFGFSRTSVDFTHDSPASFVDFMGEWYGPLRTARDRLTEAGGWDTLRAELVDLSTEVGGSGFLAPSECLVAIGRKGPAAPA
jgi:SAM-dependent methyltransferase